MKYLTIEDFAIETSIEEIMKRSTWRQLPDIIQERMVHVMNYGYYYAEVGYSDMSRSSYGFNLYFPQYYQIAKSVLTQTGFKTIEEAKNQADDNIISDLRKALAEGLNLY